MSNKIYEPVVKNSQECVRNVLKYLSGISGDKVVTGQHTQTMAMEELETIKRVTGKSLRCWGLSCYPIRRTSTSPTQMMSA